MSGKIEGPLHDIVTQIIKTEVLTSNNTIRHAVSLLGGQAPDGTQYPAEAYVTFEGDIGAKAQSLTPAPGQQPQPISARVQIVQSPKQRGGGYWTNYVLKDIALQGMLPPMAMPAPGGTEAQPVTAQPEQAQLPQTAPTPQVHPMLAGDAERASEERRRSAMHAATEFAGRLYAGTGNDGGADALLVVRSLTEDLVRYVSTGSFEQVDPSAQQAGPTAEPVVHTPETVAAEVTAEVGEGAVQVGTAGLPWEGDGS